MFNPDELEYRWRTAPGSFVILWYKDRIAHLIVEGRDKDVQALSSEFMLKRLG